MNRPGITVRINEGVPDPRPPSRKLLIGTVVQMCGSSPGSEQQLYLIAVSRKPGMGRVMLVNLVRGTLYTDQDYEAKVVTDHWVEDKGGTVIGDLKVEVE